LLKRKYSEDNKGIKNPTGVSADNNPEKTPVRIKQVTLILRKDLTAKKTVERKSISARVSGRKISPNDQTGDEKTNTALPRIGNIYVITRPHLREFADVCRLAGKSSEKSLVDINAENANETGPKT
jgi:hypothetical protein